MCASPGPPSGSVRAAWRDRRRCGFDQSVSVASPEPAAAAKASGSETAASNSPEWAMRIAVWPRSNDLTRLDQRLPSPRRRRRRAASHNRWRCGPFPRRARPAAGGRAPPATPARMRSSVACGVQPFLRSASARFSSPCACVMHHFRRRELSLGLLASAAGNRSRRARQAGRRPSPSGPISTKRFTTLPATRKPWSDSTRGRIVAANSRSCDCAA